MPNARYMRDEDSDIVRISPPMKEVKLEGDSISPSSPESDDRDLYPADQWPSARADGHVKSTEEIKRELEERVQRAVESTVKRVRHESGRIQSTAAPYVTQIQAFAERRPVLATFIAVFLATSAIPLTCFAFFVGGSIVLILGLAAVGICVTTLGTLLFATSILLPVLFFTALISLGILLALFSLFLSHRLYLHVSAACRTEAAQPIESETGAPGPASQTRLSYEGLLYGVVTWAEETVERVGVPADRLGLQNIQILAKRSSGEAQLNGPHSQGHLSDSSAVVNARRGDEGPIPKEKGSEENRGGPNQTSTGGAGEKPRS